MRVGLGMVMWDNEEKHPPWELLWAQLRVEVMFYTILLFLHVDVIPRDETPLTLCVLFPERDATPRPTRLRADRRVGTSRLPRFELISCFSPFCRFVLLFKHRMSIKRKQP